MKIVGEPMGGFGQVNEAVLDGCGLRVQAHDLVAVGLVSRDARKARVDQVLDQLRPRRLVLDQDGHRTEEIALFAHGPFEVGKVELLAQDVEEIEVRALDAPSRTDGIVGKLRRLVRRVSVLDDLIEARRALLWAIAPEPSFLDHSAAGGSRRLLILSGEVIFTDVRSGALQRFERFALGMERCAGHSRERLAAEGRLDDLLFVDLGDRGKETISHPSCLRTWPTKSSSCSRCMMMTIAPLTLSLRRE